MLCGSGFFLVWEKDMVTQLPKHVASPPALSCLAGATNLMTTSTKELQTLFKVISSLQPGVMAGDMICNTAMLCWEGNQSSYKLLLCALVLCFFVAFDTSLFECHFLLHCFNKQLVKCHKRAMIMHQKYTKWLWKSAGERETPFKMSPSLPLDGAVQIGFPTPLLELADSAHP